MKARGFVKGLRKKILSSKLETFKDCNERKRKIDQIYLKKKNVFDFSEEMEEETFSTKIEEKKFFVSRI